MISTAMLNILNALFGLLVLIGIAFVFSENRRLFPWRQIAWGVGLQIFFCLLVLGIPALEVPGPLRFIFEAANTLINRVIDFSVEGSRFIFGELAESKKLGFIFAFQVLPTIIFIGSLMSILYHLRIMQRITYGFAIIMQKTLKTSGAETLACAANIFVGQTEAALVIKPYIAKMTRSELLCLMVGGMANTAGGVLAAYVGLLRDRIPDIGGHLLTASILSAPAALLLTKIILPETEKPETLGSLPKDMDRSPHANVIDAAASGASEGLSLALNVGAMLIAFIALIALLNAGIGWLGGLAGFDNLSLQLILGWILAPFAWAIGVPASEMTLAGALLGEKTILNEFVAYVHLAEMKTTLSDRTFILMSYALSGFANFSSIAIQIGGISPLAPHRRSDLAKLGLKAVLGGTLASMMTAAVVGAFI